MYLAIGTLFQDSLMPITRLLQRASSILNYFFKIGIEMTPRKQLE